MASKEQWLAEQNEWKVTLISIRNSHAKNVHFILKSTNCNYHNITSLVHLISLPHKIPRKTNFSPSNGIAYLISVVAKYLWQHFNHFSPLLLELERGFMVTNFEMQISIPFFLKLLLFTLPPRPHTFHRGKRTLKSNQQHWCIWCNSFLFAFCCENLLCIVGISTWNYFRISEIVVDKSLFVIIELSIG